MILPDPVDHHPGSHGIIRGCQPLRKHPATATGLAGLIGCRNFCIVSPKMPGKAGLTKGPGKAGLPRRRTWMGWSPLSATASTGYWLDEGSAFRCCKKALSLLYKLKRPADNTSLPCLLRSDPNYGFGKSTQGKIEKLSPMVCFT